MSTKTEKEKMLAGEAYLASDPILTSERLAARKLTYDINISRPEDIELRKLLVRKLLGKTGENFYIEPPFRCDYGYNIEIGNNFYSNFNLVILDCAKVEIGNNVFIAPNVAIYTAGHPLHSNLRNQEYEWAQAITIGNNVWIGGNVVINPGVKIGDNSVIGSGSVVTRDIPDNVLALGNPCRVLRNITEEDRDFYYKDQKMS